MADERPLVALALPYCGRIAFGAAQGYFLTPTRGACQVVRLATESSLLVHGFNSLWAEALNLRGRGLTHFAMIHADVSPEPGWLDVLLGELVRLGADLVSAVVPIKDERGLTSTAVAGENPWGSRRLTLTEVHRLPETFGPEDVGGPLLVNSGLWVCDFTKPWCEQVHFRQRDQVVRGPSGQFLARTLSEDWAWAADLQQRGCRVYATRKVRLTHEGGRSYPNDHAWGRWQRDEAVTDEEGR